VADKIAAYEKNIAAKKFISERALFSFAAFKPFEELFFPCAVIE
jgi:hypothetical protein